MKKPAVMKALLALAVGAVCTLGVSPSAVADWDALSRSEFSVAITYAKPSNVSLEMADLLLPTSGGPGHSGVFNSQPVFLEPGYVGNYALGYRYLFACSDTWFFADYEHYQNHKERGLLGVQGTSIGGTGDVNASPGTLYTRSDVHQEMLRGGLTHGLTFGPQCFLDLSAYLEYDWLRQITHDLGNQTVPNGTTTLFTTFLDLTKNKTHGWGPGVGLKLIGVPMMQVPSFSVYGGVMTTLLYSEMFARAEHTAVAISPIVANTGGMVVTLQPESINAILAKFDVDIGIEYNRKMMLECKPMLVGLRLGVHYLNIVNALRFTNQSLATFGLQELLFGLDGGEFVDWGRVGPYLELKIGGAQS